MKYVFTSLMVFIVLVPGFGQATNVLNAYNYSQSGELDKAKEAIDKAVLHEQTKNKAKTWKYHGDIYYQILVSQNPEHTQLKATAARTSFDSFLKALRLDQRGMYEKDINRTLEHIKNLAFANAVEQYNDKAYSKAYDQFLVAVEIGDYHGKIDSLAIYNCALTSEMGSNLNLAIDWYRKCMNIEYKPAECCQNIIYLLSSEGRDEEMFQQIRECRAKYPKDQNILVAEINYNLKYGQIEKALSNLNEATKNDPGNYILHYTKGTILNQLGSNEEAIAAYNKALEINPDYFDANYNLGALYFNLGVEANNKANDENDPKKYEELKKESELIFDKALPYLEKAHQLDPANQNVLLSLQQIYARLRDTEKYNKIKELLGN